MFYFLSVIFFFFKFKVFIIFKRKFNNFLGFKNNNNFLIIHYTFLGADGD